MSVARILLLLAIVAAAGCHDRPTTRPVVLGAATPSVRPSVTTPSPPTAATTDSGPNWWLICFGGPILLVVGLVILAICFGGKPDKEFPQEPMREKRQSEAWRRPPDRDRGRQHERERRREAERTRRAAEEEARRRQIAAEEQARRERERQIPELLAEGRTLTAADGWDKVCGVRDAVWELLKPLDERSEPGSSLRAVLNRLDGLLRIIRESPPPLLPPLDAPGSWDRRGKDISTGGGSFGAVVPVDGFQARPAIVQQAVDPIELKLGCWVCQDVLNPRAPKRFLDVLWCDECYKLTIRLVAEPWRLADPAKVQASLAQYKADLGRYRVMLRTSVITVDRRILTADCPFCKGCGEYLESPCVACEGSGVVGG